jgi:arsenical pump membrane protein
MASTRATYAVIAASNLGAIFTPVGALAGIMWMSILKKHGHPITFVQFMKYGLIISIPVMLVALASLHLAMLYV